MKVSWNLTSVQSDPFPLPKNPPQQLGSFLHTSCQINVSTHEVERYGRKRRAILLAVRHRMGKKGVALLAVQHTFYSYSSDPRQNHCALLVKSIAEHHIGANFLPWDVLKSTGITHSMTTSGTPRQTVCSLVSRRSGVLCVRNDQAGGLETTGVMLSDRSWVAVDHTTY